MARLPLPSSPDDPVERRWHRGLNPEQLRAVTHRGGPLLIVAGAGSGKTRTLVARVADLIADGVPPQRMLLLTFTRRAAREMIQRAASSTGDPRTQQVLGGTFHSAANRLLRTYGRAVGLTPGFTVLDQADATDLIGLVRAELGLAGTEVRFPRARTIAAIHSRVVNAQTPLSETLERWFPWCSDHGEALSELLRTFTARKRIHQLLDYDDLLLYWRALLESSGGDVVRAAFDAVLVDEYQDTNAVQADILASLGTRAHVTVVGDDAQAIYSFRAASVRNIETFAERFPGTRVLTLERNYRSTPEILRTANAIIDAAPRRYPKQLRSTRPEGPRPRLVRCADETAQSSYVCEAVLEQRERGVALREQAVLFRTGHHSDALELELTRRDIPYVKYGGLRFLEAAHVKDLLCLLRILDNPSDVLAWSRVLTSLDGIGPATARRVLDELGLSTHSATAPGDDVLRRFLSGPLPTPSRAAEGLSLLRAALTECRTSTDGGALPPAVEIDRLRPFCEHAFRRRYDDAEQRLADLDQLAVLAADHASRTRFLADLTIDPPNATGALAAAPHLDDDWLVLSTIHSAKGCEWRCVHVIHAADGNIPSDMATGDPDEIEEERRLLYVAVTRARDDLHVTVPLRYHHRRFGLDDAHNWARPSRFLEPALATFDELSSGQVPLVAAGEPAIPSGGTDPVDSLLEELFSA